MSDIIDLNGKRAQLEGDEHYIDRHGIAWFPYSYKYSLKGKDFSIIVWATSDQEAKTEVLDSLRSLEFEGRIYKSGSVDQEMLDSAIDNPLVTWGDDDE